MFAIQTGIPIPPRALGAPLGTPKTYPFDDMKVGDSITVPIGEEPYRKVRERIASALQYHRRKTGRDRKFAMRHLGDSYGVWRTA